MTADDVFDWLEAQNNQEAEACIELIRTLYQEIDETDDFYTDILAKYHHVSLRDTH